MSFINIPAVSANLTPSDVTNALGYTPVNKAGDTMTGNLILNADPSTALQAATKNYVDSVAQGLNVKGACRVGTTGNITLSGLQTIDGVSVIAGDRVLVRSQATGSQNGIYVVASGAWTRATDMDIGSEAVSAFCFITSGSTLASTGWVQTTPAPITLGVTSLVLTQFSGAGTYTTDGQGIILSGNQFQLQLDGTTLSKSVTGLKVATGGITNNEIFSGAAIAYSKLNLSNSIVNGDISGTAGIVYSKLSLSNSIVNADINSSAAIAYSKLNLSNSIVNGDINSAAAIVYSKLSLSNSIVNADINSSAAIAYSKLNLSGSIVNGDISASAAIARSKIAAGSINQVVVNDGSGNLSSVAILPIANGGTGSSSQNFVDLTTNQTAAGQKTFSGDLSATSTSTTAFKVNTTSLVVDATNNAVGIGTAPSSIAVLDVVNNSGSTKTVQVTGYGSNVGFRGRHSNGTLSLPTATLNGNTISFFSGRGYGTTGFASAATGIINIVADGNFTDTSMPTYLSLSTTPTSSVTSVERMRVSSAGNVLIGTATDNGLNKLQVNGSFLPGIVTLTDAANIATDASLGNVFTVTLAGNRNLSAPTNPVNGQKCMWRFTQDATGGRTLTYDSIFTFGNMPSMVLSSAPGKTDYMGAIYNSTSNKWEVVAYSNAF